MTRLGLHWLALASLLGACAGSDPAPTDRGPGGKVDDARDCSEENCLDVKSYDVLFTNPVCQTYSYDEPVESADGEVMLEQKPQNVYCTREDAEASGQRPESPEFRLVEWVSALDDGDELFLAYLSYSNRVVGQALCDAAERGVDVTFVLDKNTARSDELEACGGTVLIRGHQGSVGFAHNKIFMVNPNRPGPGDEDEDFMRLSFGSGNMSSGAVLHHENWHFLEVARDSFFVESHRCLIEALVDPAKTDGKGAFRRAMNDCRADIEFEEEDDIKAYFIPALEDSRAATAKLVESIEAAASVDIGAHRFSYTEMVNALADRIASDADFTVRLVADDDLYWLRPINDASPEQVGPNDFFEADKVDQLAAAGEEGQFEVRYMETNHSLHLLHHNKFLIFSDMEGQPDGVLCGSANLTGTGFEGNLENIYYIDIPHVVDAYKAQYARFWDGETRSDDEAEPPVATMSIDMPAANITLN
jgi:phosphatidylserine/phosphatidylglycerophosphate/cardiolipin synthase-like enzyme